MGQAFNRATGRLQAVRSARFVGVASRRADMSLRQFFISGKDERRIVALNAHRQQIARRPVDAMLHWREVRRASAHASYWLNATRQLNDKPTIAPGSVLTVRDWKLVVASAVSEKVGTIQRGDPPMLSGLPFGVYPASMQADESLSDIAVYTAIWQACPGAGPPAQPASRDLEPRPAAGLRRVADSGFRVDERPSSATGPYRDRPPASYRA